MNTDEWGFPITGSKVSQVLRGHFSPEDIWELSSLDVPSGELKAPSLDVLREKLSEQGSRISTAGLCEALEGAPQVWILDIRLASDRNVVLYIEDGEIFEINLERP